MPRCNTLAILGLIFSFGLGGCESMSFLVPPQPKDNGPATDEYKVEMELVPDSELTVIDTSPVWDLGRHAYKRGTDRLLLISRITSWAEKNGSSVVAGSLRERRVERAWITIPGDEPLGTKLKLEKLQDDHYTGFDVDNLDGQGAFIGPYTVKGFLTLKETREDGKAVVDVDIEIRPASHPFGAKSYRITGVHEIPITRDGIRATPVVEGDNARLVHTPIDTNRYVVPLDKDKPATPPVDPNPSPAPVPVPTPKDPATPEAPATGATTDAPAQDDRPITGKWIVQTSQYDYRFQFDEDGTFVYATTRGNGTTDDFAPGMRYGTYTVKSTTSARWVLLLIDKFTFDDKDSMDFYKGKPQLMLKVGWEGDKLVLTGELPINNNKLTKLVLDKGSFEDMHKVLPPRGRRSATAQAPAPEKPQ